MLRVVHATPDDEGAVFAAGDEAGSAGSSGGSCGSGGAADGKSAAAWAERAVTRVRPSSAASSSGDAGSSGDGGGGGGGTTSLVRPANGIGIGAGIGVGIAGSAALPLVPLGGWLGVIDRVLRAVLPRRSANATVADAALRRGLPALMAAFSAFAAVFLDIGYVVRRMDGRPLEHGVFIVSSAFMATTTAWQCWHLGARARVAPSLAAPLAAMAPVRLPAGSAEHRSLQRTARRVVLACGCWVGAYAAALVFALVSVAAGPTVESLAWMGATVSELGPTWNGWWRGDLFGPLSVLNNAMNLFGAVYSSAIVARHVILCRATALHVRRAGRLLVHGAADSDLAPAPSLVGDGERAADAIDGGGFGGDAVDGELGAVEPRDVFVVFVRQPITRLEQQVRGVLVPLLLGFVSATLIGILPLAETLAKPAAARTAGDTVFISGFGPFVTLFFAVISALALPAVAVHSEVARLASRVSLTRSASVGKDAAGASALEATMMAALRYCGVRLLGEQRLTASFCVRVLSLCASFTLLWVQASSR